MRKRLEHRLVMGSVALLTAMSASLAHADPVEEVACARLALVGIAGSDCKRNLEELREACINAETMISCIAQADGATESAVIDEVLACSLCQKRPPVAPPGAQAVCANILRHAPGGDGQPPEPEAMESCVSTVARLGDECANPDAVAACLGSATSRAALNDCLAVCQALPPQSAR